ncbi:beta-defensin 108B [Heteronotia binoei]|uniref:beta-defensin 108B n=1 Tax=Heteronotia binoei TaxID=13085 RepID=UPI00292DFEC3|nr:beta-defensin 108B [Heteronotia binoei]
MKLFVLLFAVAFLVFQVKAKSPPANALGLLAEPDAEGQQEPARPRSPIVCNSVGGTCRSCCHSNEVSVGKCLPGLLCCQAYQ